MRLIETSSLRLREFSGATVPPYAILSHTWTEDEVTYDEMLGPHKSNQGFTKIRNFCREAQKYGLSYAWVDTCCIDKRSSAELSEAINSMYRWYREAEICMVYLVDVPP